MTNEEAIKRLNKIKAIYHGMDNKSDVKALDMAIKVLEQEPIPSISENPNKWIPVSERLPKEYKIVIVSTEDGVYPEARYSKEDGWEWAYESGADYWEEIDGVIAWMPLPEPYKGEEEITKEEAIEIIESRNFSCIECIDRSEECCKALEMAIESLSAEKTAEWINKNGIKTCNNCGIGLASAYDNYCPNCGARMKGEQRMINEETNLTPEELFALDIEQNVKDIDSGEDDSYYRGRLAGMLSAYRILKGKPYEEKETEDAK